MSKIRYKVTLTETEIKAGQYVKKADGEFEAHLIALELRGTTRRSHLLVAAAAGGHDDGAGVCGIGFLQDGAPGCEKTS